MSRTPYRPIDLPQMGRPRSGLTDLRGPMRRRQRDRYRGPFVAHIGVDGSGDRKRVYIGQGHIWGGSMAYYNWPGSGQTDYHAFTTETGTYLVGLQADVNPVHGWFSASYLPTPAAHLSTTYGNGEGSLGPGPVQDSEHVFLPVCEVVVASGVVTSLDQRWQGSDWVFPVFRMRYSDTGTTVVNNWYLATWTVSVADVGSVGTDTDSGNNFWIPGPRSVAPSLDGITEDEGG